MLSNFCFLFFNVLQKTTFLDERQIRRVFAEGFQRFGKYFL